MIDIRREREREDYHRLLCLIKQQNGSERSLRSVGELLFFAITPHRTYHPFGILCSVCPGMSVSSVLI